MEALENIRARRSIRKYTQVYGSQTLTATIQRLEERVADYRTQTELAASTDVTEE